MNAWINIDVSPDDQEIIAINQMELALGNVPKQIYKVRELITRFEVCHFKYRRHFEYILKSIAELQPVIEVDRIGLNHLHHRTNAWMNDKTKRSKAGLMYISALSKWLEDESFDNLEISKQELFKLRLLVDEWLGDKNEKKVKLIHMLLSRLLWQSVEQYRSGGTLSELEYQIEATDICNYTFPQNLDKIIQAIGTLKPVKVFVGCGTFNAEIISFLTKEFKKLCMWLDNDMPNIDLGLKKKDPIKIWLVACLVKTIKTDIHLIDPLPKLIP